MKQKELFEMYIREVIKNVLKEEIRKVLPEMIKEYSVPTQAPQPKKTAPSRQQIVNLMKQNFSLEGDTLGPTNEMVMEGEPYVPVPETVPDEVRDALTRDYSDVMKAMFKK
jgi:cation transport regulator ChaB